MLDTTSNPRPAVQPATAAAAGPSVACPNCDGRDVRPFYAVEKVPVHSCLLMASEQEATAFPTGDVRLGFCPSCGFVTNTVFDPAVHSYSPRYEETQGYSPLFNAFLEKLARRMIDQYDLHNKTILEIGCGKAEFLVLLCELGNNTGIGIDPGCIPQRIPPRTASKVTLIRDLYSEKYAHLGADFICCRHTLEHIGPTRQFLQDIRRSVGQSKQTLVFFEVPDVARVLEEGAFWDIYYEHCSYFSPGSLARLFRQTGFDLMELDLDYDDQYILATAKPISGRSQPHFDLERDLEAMRRQVDAFSRTGQATIDKWRSLVRDSVAAGRRVAIWGAGSKCVAFLTTLKLGKEITHIVDVNPHKWGFYMPGTGQRVFSPQTLAEYKPDRVIVMNPIYCPEIARDLEKMGLRPELLPVGVQ